MGTDVLADGRVLPPPAALRPVYGIKESERTPIFLLDMEANLSRRELDVFRGRAFER